MSAGLPCLLAGGGLRRRREFAGAAAPEEIDDARPALDGQLAAQPAAREGPGSPGAWCHEPIVQRGPDIRRSVSDAATKAAPGTRCRNVNRTRYGMGA